MDKKGDKGQDKRNEQTVHNLVNGNIMNTSPPPHTLTHKNERRIRKERRKKIREKRNENIVLFGAVGHYNKTSSRLLLFFFSSPF